MPIKLLSKVKGQRSKVARGGFTPTPKSLVRGFTLIEMLIVIAIIGILASIVLVGLGPVQRRGRDARRIADLREVQNGLELYFNKCGLYPGDKSCGAAAIAEWQELSDALVGSGIGVNNIPNDPSSARTYEYGTDGVSYVLAATLEDSANPALRDDIDGTVFGVDCGDTTPIYCLQF